MAKPSKIDEIHLSDIDFGLMLNELKVIEDFLPLYMTMIRKE
jgi:hypothetical protein